MYIVPIQYIFNEALPMLLKNKLRLNVGTRTPKRILFLCDLVSNEKVTWHSGGPRDIYGLAMFCLIASETTHAKENTHRIIWAPAKTSDILEQSHQDIDTWYYHETLRNDRGDTKNDDFWNTCLPDFITHVKSLGTMRDT